MKLRRRDAMDMLATIVLVMPLGAFADEMIHVRLTDKSIQLDTDTAKPGRVMFEVKNVADSNTEHEFVVLRTDADEAHLPVRNGQVTESRFKNMGELENLAKDSTKRLSLKLSPGRYVLICNRPGHYAMGMHKALVVGP
jgi:uncharacterized cupredoxin-like copper-binding protein